MDLSRVTCVSWALPPQAWGKPIASPATSTHPGLDKWNPGGQGKKTKTMAGEGLTGTILSIPIVTEIGKLRLSCSGQSSGLLALR